MQGGGMKSFKADLQRKIHNYQSILKKTYEQAESTSARRTGGAQLYNSSSLANGLKSGYENSAKSRGYNANESDKSKVPFRSNYNEETSATRRAKNENVSSIRQQYMSKIQTLNQ